MCSANASIHSRFSPNSVRMTPLHRFLLVISLIHLSCSAIARSAETAVPPGFRQPDPSALPNVFVWTDTCNAYVLRDGDAAMLIDLGDGSVLDHLTEIGVKKIEWVLFTDHHREQCQGIERLDRSATQVAAPKAEQALFETPNAFRKWYPKLTDPFTVHGASYVRPPRNAIKLDKALEPDAVFTWRDFEIRCLATPGHSPGGMSYAIRRGDTSCAFTGGVMHDGAKMVNWFDTEWDYGFAKGVDALTTSVEKLITQKLDLALPSQGPPIRKADGQLKTYRAKLATFRADYVRGYPVDILTTKEPNPNVKPTAIPLLEQVTPHLFKFSEKMAGKNFAIIISDKGKGLLLDCGIFPEWVLHNLIQQMKEHLGLKEIDALWISHMHGDHFTLGQVLKEKYGVKTWTLESIVDKCEHPRSYDYCALISSYPNSFDGMKIDRPIRDGEVIEWEGYRLQVDWMPGQTIFGNCLWLDLDGKRIAFTGDNIFGNPADKNQNGHEAVVARNNAIFEEGYFFGSRYLKDLKPDIVMGAHQVVMHNPAAFLERYHDWSKRIIALYRDLLPDQDYEYLFDPYWVSAYPYRVDFSKEDVQTVTVTVRNFRAAPQRHRVELKLPPGMKAEPAVLEATLAAKSRQSYPVKLTVTDRKALPQGVQIVPFDITLDGRRHGELFDFVVRGRE